MGVELLSDGAIAVAEAERAAVVSLIDLFGAQYLDTAGGGVALLFPFADAAQSAHFLQEAATARVLGQEKGSLRLSFASNERSLASFPFSFSLLVTLEVEGASLRVVCTLGNAGETALRGFLGARVRLRRPIKDWEDATDYRLERDAPDEEPGGAVRLVSRRSGRGAELERSGFWLQSAQDADRQAEELTFAALSPESGVLAPLQTMRAGLTLSLL